MFIFLAIVLVVIVACFLLDRQPGENVRPP